MAGHRQGISRISKDNQKGLIYITTFIARAAARAGISDRAFDLARLGVGLPLNMGNIILKHQLQGGLLHLRSRAYREHWEDEKPKAPTQHSRHFVHMAAPKLS